MQDEPGRRPGETEDEGALRDGRLLSDPVLEVGIGAAGALGEATGHVADLAVQTVVELKGQARGAGEELDGPVVVRRPEAARDDAEIRPQSVPERLLQLLLAVADDLDARGLEAETKQLPCEPRPVPVRSVAAHELAACNDQEGTGTVPGVHGR